MKEGGSKRGYLPIECCKEERGEERGGEGKGERKE
jgi:hypothetical protein